MRILSLGGLGRIHAARALGVGANPEMAASSRRIAAENFAKAINLYEDARSRNQLGVDPRYGQIYLDTADLLYRGPGASADLPFTLAENREALAASGDRYDELRRAGAYYDEAESIFDRGGYGSRLPDEALYRRAYVRYLLGREGALVDFHRAARRRPDDYEVRLALGTVLLDSEDFEASRSQYARALDLLDDELRRTGGELNPFERQGHAELLLRYVAAWNNLGVGRARSAARGGGDDDYAAALSAFAMASEYLDEVYDDMENLTSRGAVSLRDLEDRRIVVESVEDGRNLLKEKTTYPYRNRLRLLGLESADAGEDAYLVYPDIPSDLLLRY